MCVSLTARSKIREYLSLILLKCLIKKSMRYNHVLKQDSHHHGSRTTQHYYQPPCRFKRALYRASGVSLTLTIKAKN